MRLKSTVRTMEMPKGKVIGHLSDEDRQAVFMGMTMEERLSLAFEAIDLALSIREGMSKHGDKVCLNSGSAQ